MLVNYHSKDRSYSELRSLLTFEERFDYLKLVGVVGATTFGYDRYLNQLLYQSREWKHIRNNVIFRDNSCNLGIEGLDLYGNIIIHHMNPLTVEMINERNPFVFDEEYLICTDYDTHNALHYGGHNGESVSSKWKVIDRSPNDTVPWR
jgi:hypothetical protein